MSENKRITIPFLEKVLKPIVDLIKNKADKADYCIQGKDISLLMESPQMKSLKKK